MNKQKQRYQQSFPAVSSVNNSNDQCGNYMLMDGTNVTGLNRCLLSRFKFHSTGGNTYNYLSPNHKQKHGWGAHRTPGEVTAIVLLNGHGIKVLSKLLSLYSEISATLRPPQRSFFGQGIVVNADVHSWSKHRK